MDIALSASRFFQPTSSNSAYNKTPVFIPYKTQDQQNTEVVDSVPALKTPSIINIKNLNELSRLKDLSTRVEQKLELAQTYVDDLSEMANKAADASLSDAQRRVINGKFNNLYAKLTSLVNGATYQGRPLFNGIYTANVGDKLGSYVFTGANNQPTADQAKLNLPNLVQAIGKKLDISTQAKAIDVSGILNKVNGKIKDAGADLNDFISSIDFAENSLYGIPNLGPSITQVNAYNNAIKVADVSGEGIQKIQGKLFQLRGLAIQAQDDSLSNDDRIKLNMEFNAVFNEIDLIANNTKVDDVNLLNNFYQKELPELKNYITLDDSKKDDKIYEKAHLEIGDLRSGTLFGGQKPNILTTQNAAAAFESINSAIKTVKKSEKEVNEFKYVLDIMNKNMQSADAKLLNIVA